MATPKIKSQAQVATTEAPTTVDFLVSYDAGAGQDKGIAYNSEGVELARHADLALAGVSTWSDLGLRDQKPAPILIEEAVKGEDGSLEFQEHRIVFGVGGNMIYQEDARFDTSARRYTDNLALVRFHAMLSKLLKSKKGSIDLTVGMPADQYRDTVLRDNLKRFYTGQQLFFADGKRHDYYVATVTVLPQPWAAARAVRRNPPEKLRPLIAKYSMETSVIVVVDGGNKDTDVTVLRPSPNVSGKLDVTDMFPLGEAVNTMRNRVAARIQEITGDSPGLWLTEQVFTTGILPRGTEQLDISTFVADTKAAVWLSMYSKITERLGNTPMRYLIVVGGLGIVAADAIRGTVTRSGKLLDESAGFCIPARPEWAVVEGFARDHKA
jgi:hypothetical protein